MATEPLRSLSLFAIPEIPRPVFPPISVIEKVTGFVPYFSSNAFAVSFTARCNSSTIALVSDLDAPSNIAMLPDNDPRSGALKKRKFTCPDVNNATFNIKSKTAKAKTGYLKINTNLIILRKIFFLNQLNPRLKW